jgi:outer membrane protein OmpA-like peptidoglycan-associated protein
VGSQGSQGAAGSQGSGGASGTRGDTMAGNIGATGSAGASGARGVAGATGDQGPVGLIDRWNSYRVINFDSGSSRLSYADENTISQAAAYLGQNPSLQIGIDGYRDPDNQSQSESRIAAVRNGLIQAGVPSHRVMVGAFGDQQYSRDGRVELLLVTRSNSASN